MTRPSLMGNPPPAIRPAASAVSRAYSVARVERIRASAASSVAPAARRAAASPAISSAWRANSSALLLTTLVMVSLKLLSSNRTVSWRRSASRSNWMAFSVLPAALASLACSTRSSAFWAMADISPPSLNRKTAGGEKILPTACFVPLSFSAANCAGFSGSPKMSN